MTSEQEMALLRLHEVLVAGYAGLDTFASSIEDERDVLRIYAQEVIDAFDLGAPITFTLGA